MDSIRVWIRWLATIDAVPEGLDDKVVSPSLDPGEDVEDTIVTSEQAYTILTKLRIFEYA